MNLDQSTIDAVFAAAASNEVKFHSSSQGRVAYVKVNGAEYKIVNDRKHLAYIDLVEVRGNVEPVDGANASMDQHLAIADR